MEIIIQILIGLIIMNTLVKLSFWKLQYGIVFGIICAVFIVFASSFAIEQSKTQIIDFLNNTKDLQNSSVLITIESMICLGFCFVTFNSTEKKTGLLYYFLLAYPSLLVFIVLFYLLTQSIFYFTGVDFDLITYLFAFISVIVFSFSGFLLKKLIPEKELRVELHLLLSILITVLGLISTIQGNIIYIAKEQPIEINILLIFILLFIISFSFGILMERIKWKIKSKKNIK